MGHQRVEDIGREATGAAHALETLRSVELDEASARFDAVVRGDGNVLSHCA
jgi:hypothetical protein